MSTNRLKVTPAVYIVILRSNAVLLQKRYRTGYLDGYYDLPSGHVERGETIKECCVRELREETSLIVERHDLRLIHVYQNFANPDNPSFGYIFLAEKWSGEPAIQEKEKCDDMKFFALDKLPGKTVAQVKEALKNVKGKSEVTFSLLGLNHKIKKVD